MTDGFTAPDVSMPASAETASSPSEAAPSASVQSPEAVSATTGVAPVSDAPASESVPDAPPELPDEQTFARLSGPERGNNWKQARARIAELNQQVEQFSTHQPAIEQIEQLGGWEAVQQAAELGSLLFSQVQDPESGQLSLTAEPLIERLASESPETLGEIVWKGIHAASPWYRGETLLDTVLRDKLGLDPALLDTYRAIQNPADARQYLQPGQVSAEELAAIPTEFQDAYKSLSPRQREEIALVQDEDARKEFLQDKADALTAREFIARQKAADAEAQRQAERQFTQRVEQRTAEISGAARDAALNAARARLQAEASFSPEAEVNEAVHGDALGWAVNQCLADPALAADNDRSEALYKLAAEAELRGDRIKSAQYKVQADSIAKKLEGRFLNMLTKRVAFWSKALGGVRQAQQQQIEQARPRPELAQTNQPSSRQNQPTQTVGRANSGFGWTPQQLEQMEAALRARQMGG